MKLTTMLCVCFFCTLSAKVMSQERLSMQLGNVTIKEVFEEIRRQTDRIVFCNDDRLDLEKKVEANFKEMDLGAILDHLLSGSGMTYRYVDDYILIVPARVETTDTVRQPLTLKGRVTDEKGNPLPGVTVLIKGTNLGVATDADGRFKMMQPSDTTFTLSFSFVGYKTVEVKYTGQDFLDVVLKETAQKMDEVVITGYQTIDRRDVVGSYSVVKADEIMMPAYTSIDQMLQGQVAGLMVINTSSRVGTSPKLLLRGTSTLLGNTEPLWVVDGIVQEDPLTLDAALTMTQDLADIIGGQISWLNPMDIETITVLKDASATAIYGSKASNGVIVITTKKGKMGRMTVNYTGNITINTRPNYGMFNYMNSKERLKFSQDMFNSGAVYEAEPIAQPYTYEGALKMYMAGEMTAEEFTKQSAFLETVNTDWFDLLTRSGVSHSHNLSLSGGTEQVTYNASVGYSNTLGQEIGNDSERLSARVSTNIRAHEKVTVDASITASVTTTNTFGNGVDPLNYATTTSRALPAYDENGAPLFYRKRCSYGYNSNVTDLGYNFINERENTSAQNENIHFAANLNFRWNMLDWLSYEFTGGYTVDVSNAESWMGEQSYAVAQQYRGYDYGTVDPGSVEFEAAVLPFGGVLFTTNTTQKSYNVQNKLLFTKNFNDEHRLNAMIAMEVRSSDQKGVNNQVWGYLPERGETLTSPASPDELQPLSGAYSGFGVLEAIYNGLSWKRTNKTDNYFSYFATLAYSLKDRYVFNASMRNDESNRFGQDVNHRFDPTYSFGFSWAVAEEPWMQGGVNRWINSMNVRATYGIQGNAMTRLGPDLILMQTGIDDVYNDYTSVISSLPNPNLSWERTKSWDFGLDLRVFNMFDLALDYYMRNSNVIVAQDLAPEYGVPSMQMNGGKITNSGVEFTLAVTPIQTKDWALSLSLNSAKNWNETGEPEYKPQLNHLLNGSSERVLVKGKPVGGFWSYSFAGLSEEDGRPLFNYLDVPEEEIDYDVDPLTFLVYSGTSDPDFSGGLSFSLRYKNVTLSSGLTLMLGGKKRLPSPFEGIANGVYVPEPDVNLSKDLTKRWQKPGDEKYTIIPAIPTNDLESIMTLPNNTTLSWMTIWEQSDAMVVDASYLRCRQVSLTYRLGNDYCKKLRLKSLSLSATVSNLFVIADDRFNGFDPELGDSVYPKNYSIGINVGF